MTAATAAVKARMLDPFTIVGLTGVMFAVIGGAELVTQIFPMALGSPEWEFGTYSSVMDSMPLFLMGLGFLGAYAVTRSMTVLARVLGIVFVLLALFVLAGAFLYSTNLPQALRMNPGSPMQTGMKKAVVKGAIQSAIYPIAFLWFGVFMLKNAGAGRRS